MTQLRKNFFDQEKDVHPYAFMRTLSEEMASDAILVEIVEGILLLVIMLSRLSMDRETLLIMATPQWVFHFVEQWEHGLQNQPNKWCAP